VNKPSYKHAAAPSVHPWRHILHALILAITLAYPAAAPAQAPLAGPGSAPITSGEVKIELESFGVGNVARVGEWCGIRLKVTDTGTKSRELIIRVAGLDYDGDTPMYQRAIASNPGTAMSVWIYTRLPFSYNGATGLTAYAYESLEGGGDDADGQNRRAGRLLGYADIRTPTGPSGVVREATEALMAVVGPQARPLGLSRYSSTSGGNTLTRPNNPHAHEVTSVVMGLNPASMPDRWIGLQCFDAVVWAQGDPVQLDEARSNAIREYVEHGGHFIIVLPAINQTWTDPRSNKLLDVMPMVTLSQKDVDDFQRYRPLLSRLPAPAAAASSPIFPSKMSVYTFTPRAEVAPGEAIRVLNGPDGDCVVVRRLVGAGAITLVGLDLNHTALSQFELIDNDMFWHRVLGRRGDYAPRPAQGTTMGFGRKQWIIDQDIQAAISKTRNAAVGVLVGFVVFVVYWLAAAPLGYFVLKRYNLTRHAWVAFVATAGVFTVISWTGAKLLRESKVVGSHLTILDHVYGQPLQRAKMWSGVSIPWYGTATLSIPSQDTGSEPQINNLIASWDPPAADNAAWGGFPDVRGYVVDTRRPDTIRVPARSTVKQVEVVWAGGPRWEMPRPMRPEEGGSGALRLTDPQFRLNAPSVEGTLVHNLPGPLRDMLVIVVRKQLNLRRYSTEMPIALGEIYTTPTSFAWKPDDPLDLRLLTASADRTSELSTVLNTRIQKAGGASSDFSRRMEALALFNMLPPPEQIPGSDATDAAARVATHGWDLGMWFTQPCVIIIGTVGEDREDGGVDSPVPLTVDGELVPNTGRTVVRWIYPLPDDPPAFPQSAEPDPANPEPAAKPAE